MNKHLIAIFAILAMLFAFSCGGEDKDLIKIRIFSYGSEFYGWYVMNGESPVFFLEDTVRDGDTFYREILLEDLDEVEVEVTTVDPVSSLAIRLYRDETKVKEVSQDASLGTEIMRLNVFYVYGESSSDET